MSVAEFISHRLLVNKPCQLQRPSPVVLSPSALGDGWGGEVQGRASMPRKAVGPGTGSSSHMPSFLF